MSCGKMFYKNKASENYNDNINILIFDIF